MNTCMDLELATMVYTAKKPNVLKRSSKDNDHSTILFLHSSKSSCIIGIDVVGLFQSSKRADFYLDKLHGVTMTNQYTSSERSTKVYNMPFFGLKQL